MTFSYFLTRKHDIREVPFFPRVDGQHDTCLLLCSMCDSPRMQMWLSRIFFQETILHARVYFQETQE
jgi:hypothetical protein